MSIHTDDLIELAMAGRELEAILFGFGVEFSIRLGTIDLVVHKTKGLRITIDGDRDHHAPHVHIDVGGDKHAGSYTINDGERVAGKANKYDDRIKHWIRENRQLLERVYQDIRADGYAPADVTILLETTFPEKNSG